MSTISRDEAAHLARLARLDLAPDELEHLAGQLDAIAEFVAKVAQVAADDIPPASHALPMTNVFRDDAQRPGLTQEQALDQAPGTENGRFRVPKVLGEQA